MESTFMCVDQRAVMQLMEEDNKDENNWSMKQSLTSFNKRRPTPDLKNKI